MVVKVLRKEAEKETLKSAMCDTTTRLGFSASVFSQIVSNPHYLEFLE